MIKMNEAGNESGCVIIIIIKIQQSSSTRKYMNNMENTKYMKNMKNII